MPGKFTACLGTDFASFFSPGKSTGYNIQGHLVGRVS